MLFEEKRFRSKYDFGEEISDFCSMDSLASEIARISSLIEEYAMGDSTKEEPKYNSILLQHKDKDGQEIWIDGKKLIENEERVSTRTEGEIKQLLFRPIKSSKASIAKSLAQLGVRPPENFSLKKDIEQSKENYKYLQTLYFFYMMRYFIFPHNNFFLEINEKHLSTDYSPFQSSSNGNYWWFIISNASEDKDALTILELRDSIYTTYIHEIATTLDDLISKDYDYAMNRKMASDIYSMIDDVCLKDISLPSKDDSVSRLLAVAYKYQLSAYSSDMLSNLGGDNRPFDFPELDISINPGWKDRLLNLSDIIDFLREDDVISFCRQGSKYSDRTDRGISPSAITFLLDLIQYDGAIHKEYGESLFTTVTDEQFKIAADIAVIIIRTFYDIKQGKEQLFMQYKSGDKWIGTQALNSALTEKGKKKTGLIADLAMRVFVVAFHSEYLNVYAGHGYYVPLFQNIYLQRYLLVQKIVNSSFSSGNPNEWKRRLDEILINLQTI